MSSQYLFTYGTLKSDQPEHEIHCTPPLSIKPAKARGSLWRLREGYPILQVDPNICLVDASNNPAADWDEASAKKPQSVDYPQDGNWIEGELFEYSLDSGVLAKMDAWENFIPGVKSAYQRRIIWVQDADGTDRMAWAYVCYSPPNWATLLSQNRWN